MNMVFLSMIFIQSFCVYCIYTVAHRCRRVWCTADIKWQFCTQVFFYIRVNLLWSCFREFSYQFYVCIRRC